MMHLEPLRCFGDVPVRRTRVITPTRIDVFSSLVVRRNKASYLMYIGLQSSTVTVPRFENE